MAWDEWDEATRIICLKCGWRGYPENLIAKTVTAEDNDYSYCPYCANRDCFDKKVGKQNGGEKECQTK